jgi:hypothetical protein
MRMTPDETFDDVISILEDLVKPLLLPDQLAFVAVNAAIRNLRSTATL